MSRFLLKIQKVGFAIVRPYCWRALLKWVVPASEHCSALSGLSLDRVLDVGANRGQFSLIARIHYPQIPIESFEPQSSEASVYKGIFGGDSRIKLHEIALGDIAGEADLHISRRKDSSSLLPIGEMQSMLFPSTEEVGINRVFVKTLDSFAPAWKSSKRMLLKLDVQGFELGVLRGATTVLRQCAYVYVECSEVALYTGQALFPEVRSFLEEQGFRHLRRLNEQYDQGRLIQSDNLFIKDPTSSAVVDEIS
jgi:FkbM family methyltransferase